ncbi:hypothetical protein ASPZODRAFT_21426 [Penicilliopsis zonata CBS 506.65]|uniref:Large ribosomal subunit protein uL23m n=1 Tax=Penicilliopsis zonata CBS 506.65 TaxID=1073090 RepID=A0A1L9SV32_9EURO|nr:hypothetical protein ASPZODRAFT_21426 [Penicilliopsis zonata CBS 506.65]OJJ50923.1 hypothetical protein ASPZODRAFT_21426 [Penicilliopsis zonata CBS 506.65]
MVRRFSKFPKKPADWLPPTAPLSMRKQVFLPEFTIALIRTPFLAPRYASFYVPLNFNKLDMRDYLKRLYGVTTVSIRSFVEQQKITRMRPLGKFGYGRWRRPQSKKKMTVEMTEPFAWPEAPKDMAAWETEQYYKAKKYQDHLHDQQRPEAAMEANKEDRQAFEEQAKELQDGKRVWRPTWQALGLNYDRTAVNRRSKGSASS